MSLFNAYMSLSGGIDAEVVQDERLAHRTTYRIGGPASLFVTANTYAALVKTLKVLEEERVPWVILGRGSNVLVADAGYKGCVIKLGREFSRISVTEEGQITAGAGTLLSKLVSQTLAAELTGLEFCVGIPGTVGGAVSMNAGTRREWVGSLINSVVTLRPGEGMHRYAGADIDWGYRWCSLSPGEIILEATFELAPGTKEAIASDMERRLTARRGKQPMGRPSCGSVFRNPPDRSVGRLIERCGLKGTTQGGAQISTTHANFIVNQGTASASDVVALMGLMHDRVLEEFEIDLVPEVKLLGFEA